MDLQMHSLSPRLLHHFNLPGIVQGVFDDAPDKDILPSQYLTALRCIQVVVGQSYEHHINFLVFTSWIMCRYDGYAGAQYVHSSSPAAFR